MKTTVLALTMMMMAPLTFAQFTQLDLSGGFNTDNWAGAKEIAEVMTIGGTDLGEAQGNLAEGVGFNAFGQANLMVGEIDAATAQAIGARFDGSNYMGYAGTGSWFRPNYKDGTQGTPLDGVLTSSLDSRVYHIASHGGNATLPGDWLQATDVSFTGSGSSAGGMAVKFNALSAYSPHSNATQVASATAILPVAQQGKYTDINLVLGAWDHADGARNMRIVAIYGDSSEDILYSFSTDDMKVGPIMRDAVADVTPVGDFSVVAAFSQNYGSSSGSTGAVINGSGSLFEFTSPILLDPSKDLIGIRVEDANPALNWNSRGLSVFGATATAIPEPASLMMILVGAGIVLLARKRR